MQAYEFLADVDEQRHLTLSLPLTSRPGKVRVIVLAEETEEEAVWMQGIAQEWAAELSDTREDIYTLADGEPANVAR